MNYSVLMSVYKNDKPIWLYEAIFSILNNTIKPNDFVIVKDGPVTKEIDEVISRLKKENPGIFNIVALEINMGLGPALNRGILACKNNLIARIDADDISDDKRIEKQLKIFEKFDVDICGTMAKEFKDDINNVCGLATFPVEHNEIVSYAKKRNPFCHPSIMFKKDAVIKAGNYQACHLCEDYDLWIRMITSGSKCYNIDEYLHYWRVSDDFYKRRSGVKYLKSILSFLKKIYKNGFLTRKEYYNAVIIRSLVYLMPNKFRKFIYKHFLRKKAVDD